MGQRDSSAGWQIGLGSCPTFRTRDWDSGTALAGPIPVPSAIMGRRSTGTAITKQAPHLSEEPAQIPGAFLQYVRIVLGKAEHRIAAAAKQATYCEECVAMIDKEHLLGLLLADFAPAALMRQHRIVFLQGYPVGLLEILLTEPDTNPFGVNGILLHFATPLGRDFLLVGLPIGNAISEFPCSTDGIHCTFFLFAFTLTHEIFPSSILPCRRRSVPKQGARSHATSRARTAPRGPRSRRSGRKESPQSRFAKCVSPACTTKQARARRMPTRSGAGLDNYSVGR
jgi:hypothetical protein